MKRMNLVALLALAMLLLAACGDDETPDAESTDRGTADEAVAMVARAVEAYDEQGTGAFELITEPSTEFVDRDLYVFVFGPEGSIVAHGLDAELIGREASTLVDSQGREFALEFMERATPEGVWVDYAWTDPLSGDEVEKSSWVVRHDDYVFGVGIYKPEGEVSERGTKDEAVAMVERAVAAYDEDGVAVFERISAPSTEFVDRDLYVFVLEADGTTVAHGGDAANVGQVMSDLVDIHGKAFGAEIVERAAPEGVWVDYTWTDPLTDEPVEKSTWVRLHDGYIFGVGIYLPE